MNYEVSKFKKMHRRPKINCSSGESVKVNFGKSWIKPKNTLWMFFRMQRMIWWLWLADNVKYDILHTLISLRNYILGSEKKKCWASKRLSIMGKNSPESNLFYAGNPLGGIQDKGTCTLQKSKLLEMVLG